MNVCLNVCMFMYVCMKMFNQVFEYVYIIGSLMFLTKPVGFKLFINSVSGGN